MSRSDQIASGLVRIWGKDDRAVGAGFLIAARTIVTCAHVAALALRVGDEDLLSCGEALTLDFALLSGATAIPLQARVVAMPSVPDSAEVMSDIAILELDGDLPLGAGPLRLSGDREIRHHPFRTFGFPSFSPDNNGDWAEGVIEGTGSVGLLQMRSSSQQGRRVQRGYSGAPVWDAEIGQVIGMIVKADRLGDDRVAYAIPSWDLASALAGGTGTIRCPYRGLESFGKDDAEFFFGRDEFVARLITRVRERSMLAVIGPSGAGKSSAIAAGLVVHYLAEPDWRVVWMRPGRHPFRELAYAILPILEPGLTPVERLDKASVLADIIRKEGLQTCLASAPGDGRYSLLVIIDQFEELFTISADADVKSFIDTIVESANEYSASQVDEFCVVLAMRTEFLTVALDHPGLANAINPAEILGGMSANQLRSVIEDPIRGTGVKFAEGLVDRIMYDAPNNAQLPLVEFLLTSLWADRDNFQMTHSAYQQLGGVGGALAQHAELVFARLSHQDQDRTKAILMRLVTARIEDTPATCRVADHSEFDAESWRLVQHLSDRRLLLVLQDLMDNQTVQVVHEALTTKWERFAGWIAENRKHLVTAGEVRDAAGRWIARNRDSSWLLRGEALTEATVWAKDAASADPATLEFVAKSLMREVTDKEVRDEFADDMIHITERTENIPLRLACLARVIRARVNYFEPFIAFAYWRRLWRYEAAMKGSFANDGGKEWNDAVQLIWPIIGETVPIIGVWLLSWFVMARLGGDAINFHHNLQTIAMGATVIVVSIAFWCVRRTFRNPPLVLPVLLAASVLLIRAPLWGKPYSPAWLTALEWRSICLAIPPVGFTLLLFYLGMRYMSARKRRKQILVKL